MYCLCRLCRSVHCLCVNVYCTTATGFKPTAGNKYTISYTISYINHVISHIIYHITSYHISYHINNRMAKIMLIVHQTDEGDLEDLWRDLDDAERGLSKPNWWRMMMMLLLLIMIVITNILCGTCGAYYTITYVLFEYPKTFRQLRLPLDGDRMETILVPVG